MSDATRTEAERKYIQQPRDDARKARDELALLQSSYEKGLAQYLIELSACSFILADGQPCSVTEFVGPENYNINEHLVCSTGAKLDEQVEYYAEHFRDPEAVRQAAQQVISAVEQHIVPTRDQMPSYRLWQMMIEDSRAAQESYRERAREWQKGDVPHRPLYEEKLANAFYRWVLRTPELAPQMQAYVAELTEKLEALAQVAEREIF